MDGQWMGHLQGNDPDGSPNGGVAILDLDDDQDGYRGSAFYFDDRPEFSGTLAYDLFIPKGVTAANIVAKLLPLDRQGSVLSPPDFQRAYPGLAHADRANLKLNLTADGLELAFATSLGSTGAGLLTGSEAEQASLYQPMPDIQTWADFKSYASARQPHRSIFRGQPCIKRLRTSFHRTRRTDLVRFVNGDVSLLHRQLSPITRHLFRLHEPGEMGAFYNLIQHHGYPTPLLDWSASPFIAAFFAFRDRNPPDGKVRIFIFDREAWCSTYRQYQHLTNLPPHLSVLELLGVENQRMIPQQALSTLTNIDDIEGYIREREVEAGRSFLSVIDLPAGERNSALTDLSLMGITAASLFPGLDGTCEAMKGRMFGY